MDSQAPRPNLNRDEAYLRQVRDLYRSKGKIEDIHFEYLTDVWTALGFEMTIRDTYETGENGEAIPKETAAKIVADSFERLQTQEPTAELLGKLHRLWDYLAESDPLEPADLIFVFGGISTQCVEEAIRLKKEGVAPKILFSGKKASYMNDVEVTEASRYKQQAIELGVSEADILIEQDSINTPENAVNSAQLLHRLGWLPKKVIAVSLPYHMKRASLTLRAVFDWDFQLIRHPGASAKYTQETYFKDKNGWSYICFEYMKMFWAQSVGHF